GEADVRRRSSDKDAGLAPVADGSGGGRVARVPRLRVRRHRRRRAAAPRRPGAAAPRVPNDESRARRGSLARAGAERSADADRRLPRRDLFRERRRASAVGARAAGAKARGDTGVSSHPRGLVARVAGPDGAERGWWDAGIDGRRYRLSVPPAVVRALGWLLPRPDLALVLHGDPRAVALRKGELVTAEVARQNALWRRTRAGHRQVVLDAA